MLFIIGLVIVFGSVLGGYLPHGSIGILIQPLEWLIILGSAVGSLVVGTPKDVTIDIISKLKWLLADKPYAKKDYGDLLGCMYKLLQVGRKEGNMAFEAHAEVPNESKVFQQYPSILKNKPVITFIADYLRLISMGSNKPLELEQLMDEDIKACTHDGHAVAHAVHEMSQALPAFGIVAAVLGVIVTMESISEPPEILGSLIAAALVGTFFGVFVAYAVFAPMGQKISTYNDARVRFYECIKICLLAYLNGNAPPIAVEFARKVICGHEQPSFKEVEEICQN